MTSETPANQKTADEGAKSPKRRAHIGSYVLESLTTGMYGEPRHTMREYVQNAFDAIEAARESEMLAPGEGTVVITIDNIDDKLSIKDDGTGLRSDVAWKTLSAVGASTKERTERAGFRGIGRLAGLAYCEKLKFVTKHRSDDKEATITFDCKRLRDGMDPTKSGGEDIQTLLTEAVTDTYREVNEDERDLHYTEVILEKVGIAPESVKNMGKLSAYLCQTAPVDFHPELWSHSQKIKKFAAAQGKPLKTIKLLMKQRDFKAGSSGDERIEAFEVFKPYRNNHKPKGKGPVEVKDVILHADATGVRKWWGWIGEMPALATLADDDAAGLRVRAKNIQIDGTDVVERMFSEIRVSYARFNKYFIGEFHVLSDDVVPNARRDGFEENEAWQDIQDEISPLLSKLTKSVYKSSKGRNDKYKSFKLSVDAASEAVEKRITLPPGVDGGNDHGLLLHINDIAQTLASEIARDLASEDDVKALMQATVNESRRRLQRAISTDVVSEAVGERFGDRDRILKIVWNVLQDMMDPVAYRTARREIEGRLSREGLL